jgi:hypothetical protein
VRDRKRAAAAFAVVAVVVLAVVIGIGEALSRRAPDGPPAPPTGSATSSDRAGDASPPTPAEPAEAVRYWVEAREARDWLRRSTGADPLPTAIGFRFHVVAASPGYVYVLGRNKQENLALLASGSTKRPLATGEEFVFPKRDKEWARPTSGSSVDQIIFVFSPVPLDKERYLAATPPHKLTPAELQRFEALRHACAVTASNLRPADGETSMRVLTATLDRPVVFDLTIVHGA